MIRLLCRVMIAGTMLMTAMAQSSTSALTLEEARTGGANIKGCVSDSTAHGEAKQMITLRNDCDFTINVRLCAQSSRSRDASYYFYMLTSQSEVRHRLALEKGETYDYSYNTCGKPNCMPPKGRC